MAEKLTGWQPDPYGVHELRYFAAGGTPTRLVRDGDKVSNDEPPQSLPQTGRLPSTQSLPESTSTPATADPQPTVATQPAMREQTRPVPASPSAPFAEDRSVWTAKAEPASVSPDVRSTATYAPAGWYQDLSTAGQLRYWDGVRWTDQTHVALPSMPLAVPPAYARPGLQTGPLDAKGAAAAAKAANAHAKALRPWYRKKRFALLAMLAILLIVIIAVASGGKPKSAKGPSPTSPGNKNWT
jgi:hypothetical protein